MKEIDCNIIRDLLPLYEDDVASQETQELVRGHLADCPACQEELRKLRTPISLPPDEDEEAVKRFLKYREEVRRKQNGKIIRFVTAVTSVAAVLILILLWYTRPMTLEQLCPNLRMEDCRAIRGYYTNGGASGPQEFTLSAEDLAFTSLLEQFRGRTFRRSLLGLLDQGTRTHIGGGFTWEVYFEFEDVPFPDGSTNSGSLLRFNNFYGTVDISYVGDTLRQVSTAEKDQWVAGVFNIISAKDG